MEIIGVIECGGAVDGIDITVVVEARGSIIAIFVVVVIVPP